MKLDSISSLLSGVGASSSLCGWWSRRTCLPTYEARLVPTGSLLSKHLVRSGCGHSLSHPLVDVSVD